MSRDVHLKTWGKPLFDAIRERSPGVSVYEFRLAFAPLMKSAILSGELDKLPEENLEAIDDLVKLGKTVVILTSREHAELEHMLGQEHVLNNRISSFYYKENMQFHKPDPRAFEHIEREHGWKPQECVYVGDSLGDVAAAKGAGLYFIASLESGLKTAEDFRNYPVDAFIHTFPEVVPAVAQLDKNLG